MTMHRYHPWIHRFAVATTCIALLPIVVGAAVTTLRAGMAFNDWPSSDGYSMLAYPWLQSAGDKFVEHGHRLAGIVIGLFSIALCVLVWRYETRRWVHILGTAVLIGVVLQGLLGGARVLLNDPRLALIHAGFAACVFVLIASMALFTSQSWLSVDGSHGFVTASYVKPISITASVVIFIQYVLGGLIRHLGTGLHEHLAFALVVLLAVLMNVAAAYITKIRWLRHPAHLLLGLVLIQVVLGAGSWVTKFGFTPLGYVTVKDSIVQIVMRTSHTVVGMLLLMTSVNLSLRVSRLNCLDSQNARLQQADEAGVGNALSITGGFG